MRKKEVPGHIYFILSKGTDAVKIGWAKVPDRRLRELQVASPSELVILATIPGTQDDETAWHLKYSDQRIRGEWFLVSRRLLRDIGITLSQIRDVHKDFNLASAPVIYTNKARQSADIWAGDLSHLPSTRSPLRQLFMEIGEIAQYELDHKQIGSSWELTYHLTELAGIAIGWASLIHEECLIEDGEAA